METQQPVKSKPGAPEEKRKEPSGVKKAPAKPKIRILLVSAVVLVCAVIVVALILTDVISGGKEVKAGAIESVLILPFGNYTGNDQLEPLVSGMHSSLIREMGRLSGLRVICKTSSDAFKGADMTVHEIAREMNVDAVIEPSVLCWGDTICMAFSMISGDPDNNFVNGPLAEAYLATGDTLKWHKTMKRRWFWADDEYLAYLDTVFQEGGYIAVIEDRIRVNEERYSHGGSIPLRGQAERYLAVKNYDKAMDYYEKAYAEKNWTLAYVSLDVIEYPELKDNPRYIALLKKMNLPVGEN